jgi:hypothetical protein
MIFTLPMMLAASLALQDGPSAEALVDRLIEAFPDGDEVDAVDRTADPAEMARLEAVNPGRAEDIRPVLEGYAACESAMRITMTRRGMSRIVARMGAAKVERLIAFYRGEDLGRFEALSRRLAQGEPLSGEAQADHDRIAAAYPIYEFAELMQADLPASMLDGLAFDELSRCVDEKAAALERIGVQDYPGEAADDSAQSGPAE